MDPVGMCWEISTRAVETTLLAWFDEVLPWCYVDGRPGIDDFDRIYPRILVHPMWAWKMGPLSDPDWLCDSRALGRLEEFRATAGETGLKALLELRQALEREVSGYADR